MKHKFLWLYVCWACVCNSILEGKRFEFIAVVILLLLCILERCIFRRDLKRQKQDGKENGFWETFSKEFASSLAKAIISLLTALVGALLLGKTSDIATPATIGITIATIILSSLGAF